MSISDKSVLDLQIDPELLKEFCRKNHIRTLSLYGSALRGELQSESDIDLLVEFESGNEPGLIELAGMELELEKYFSREVEMRTSEDLSSYFRSDVIAFAEIVYAKE